MNTALGSLWPPGCDQRFYGKEKREKSAKLISLDIKQKGHLIWKLPSLVPKTTK